MKKIVTYALVVLTSLLVITGCGRINKKYEKPIAKRYDDRIEADKMKLFGTKEYRQ